MGDICESGKGKRKYLKPVFMVLLFAVVMAVFAFMLLFTKKSEYYKTHFQENVFINGIPVGGLTAEEADELISENIEDYSLKLVLRYMPREEILGSDIGLKTEYERKAEDILKEEERFIRLFNTDERRDYSIARSVSFDEDKLLSLTDELECLKAQNVTEPRNAYIALAEDKKSFTIVSEVEGNLINKERLKSALRDAVSELSQELDLDKSGVYEEPDIRETDPELNKRLSELNRYMRASIKLDMGQGRTEVCDSDDISEMIITDSESGMAAFSDEKLREYVEETAAKYDTVGKIRRFETVYGSIVEVTGDYGRETDIEAETERLKADIFSGDSIEREPVYKKKPQSSENDWGDSYIEVNLTAQKLFVIKDGKEIMSSDIVSGCEADGCGTASGIYEVTGMETNVTVEDKAYPVNYCVIFGDDLSFYDASWRSAFGGNIYKTSGTGGSISLPYSKAKELYRNSCKGMPVICYRTADEARQDIPAGPTGELPCATSSDALHFQKKDI